MARSFVASFENNLVRYVPLILNQDRTIMPTLVNSIDNSSSGDESSSGEEGDDKLNNKRKELEKKSHRLAFKFQVLKTVRARK